jgi:hypothetical protein
MKSIYDFIIAHKAVLIAIGSTFSSYHVVSAAISNIPPLPPNAGFWETWFYKIFQVIAANYDKVSKK